MRLGNLQKRILENWKKGEVKRIPYVLVEMKCKSLPELKAYQKAFFRLVERGILRDFDHGDSYERVM